MTIEAQAPSPKALITLSNAFGLDGRSARTLSAVVHNVAAVLNAGLLDEVMPGPEQRRAQLHRLEQMAKYLEALTKLCDPPDDATRQLLRRLFAEQVGRSLSGDAIERTLDSALPTDLSARLLESREATGRAGPYRVLDREMTRRRVAAAADTAERLMAGQAAEQLGLVSAYLSYQRQDPGGAPGDRARRFVIKQLLKAFPRIFDAPPTSTITGTFVRLCSDVLQMLGRPTDGVENAVGRELSKAKKRSESP